MNHRTERRVCIICNEHRAEQGDFCARCWAEYADDIRRDAPWIKERRQAATRQVKPRQRAAQFPLSAERRGGGHRG